MVPNFLSADELTGPVMALEEEPRFFFAGRLEEIKGIRDMLDVYASDGPGWARSCSPAPGESSRARS